MASQHVIALNNKEGKAIFYERSQQPKIQPVPFGSITNIFTSPQAIADVSVDSNADLATTAEISQNGFSSHRITLDNGLAYTMLVLSAGATVPMHRTRTLDMGVIVEGEIELHLDSGEVKTLKQGDSLVLRGAMHKWRNSTDKDCKLYVVIVDAQPIKDANGAELGEEFRGD